MKTFRLTALVLICSLGAVATAQDRAGTGTPAGQSAVAQTSEAQAAIDKAVAANKYVFLFFWKEKGSQADKMLGILQPAVAKMADTAEVVSIQVTDPAEKKIVDKYGVSRAPMPMVLAVAPCGAITKAFIKPFDEKELRTAFVSDGTQRCLKALQDGKLVFVCVVDQASTKEPAPVPKGVEDFKADEKYGGSVEVVVISVRDTAEATFLKELEVGAKAAPVTVFLAPPGALIGTFDNTTTKETFAAKLAAAQSSCCPGGKCGPGGCGSKK